MPKQYGAGGSGGAEWSHVVDVDKLSHEPRIFKFSADERERIDLARRLGIVSIEEAEAVVTLQRVSGGIIHAMGMVRANLTQACIASLAPVFTQVEEEFEGWYGDKTATAVSFAKARSEREAKKGPVEIELMEESADPEPVINGKIDIGELATQYLSLGLDPYPRAEGVSPVYSIGPADKDGEGAEIRK